MTNQNAAIESAYPGPKQVVTEQIVVGTTIPSTPAADDRLPSAGEGAAHMATEDSAEVSNTINFRAIKTGAVLSVTGRSEGEIKQLSLMHSM